MNYASIEKRLEALEAEQAEQWVRSLTNEELEAAIAEDERADPEAWARLKAMTDEELNAELQRLSRKR